jgi:hypothetical protein
VKRKREIDIKAHGILITGKEKDVGDIRLADDTNTPDSRLTSGRSEIEVILG